MNIDTCTNVIAVNAIATKCNEFVNTVRILDFLDKYGSAKLGTIAQNSGMSKSGAWFKINKLIELGLVTKIKKNEEHKISTTYSEYTITSYGRKMLPDIKKYLAKKIVLRILCKDLIMSIDRLPEYYKLSFKSGIVVMVPRKSYALVEVVW